MNLHAEIRTPVGKLAKGLAGTEPQISHSDHESSDDSLELPADAVKELIKHLGLRAKDEVLISVLEHATTAGEGFRPRHVTVTVSLSDPNAS